MNGKCCLEMLFFQKLSFVPLNRKFQALRTCHIVFHPACIASRTGFNLNHHLHFRCGWQLAVSSWDGVAAKTPHTLLRELLHTFDTKADRLPVDRGEDQPAGFFGGLDIFDPFPNTKKMCNLNSDSEVNLMRFTRFQEKKQL